VAPEHTDDPASERGGPGGEGEAALTERLATLESLEDAVYTLDRDWRFTYLNAEAERLVHRSRDELLGRVVWDQFPEARESELYELYRHAVTTGEVVRIPAYDYPPLDTVFEIRAYPSELGLAVQFRDVSEHVDRQRDLERVVDEEQRTAERLRELDDVKNTFLSAVSHELRTPLMIVRGLAEQLREMRGQLDEAERHEIEDEIHEQAAHLERLLTDLLDVDRLSRGALGSRQMPVDLVQIVTAVVAEHDVAGRVDLDVPERLPAEADPGQVERIVVNLVENAAKYAPDGSIQVRLSPLPDGGGRLEVIDDGPGIPDHARERVFEPLYRVDEDHPRPGTGIGLSLVAAFADLHGGVARALPRHGGAHIQVDLPGAVSEDAGR
jgi:PAS domain S-box-containing protein